MRRGRWQGELAYCNFRTGGETPCLVNAFAIRHSQTGAVLGLAVIAQRHPRAQGGRGAPPEAARAQRGLAQRGHLTARDRRPESRRRDHPRRRGAHPRRVPCLPLSLPRGSRVGVPHAPVVRPGGRGGAPREPSGGRRQLRLGDAHPSARRADRDDRRALVGGDSERAQRRAPARRARAPDHARPGARSPGELLRLRGHGGAARMGGRGARHPADHRRLVRACDRAPDRGSARARSSPATSRSPWRASGRRTGTRASSSPT